MQVLPCIGTPHSQHPGPLDRPLRSGGCQEKWPVTGWASQAGKQTVSVANEREPGLGPWAQGGVWPSLILTAGGGEGAGDQRWGEPESRQRVPWRPDPSHSWTDRGEGARPCPPAVALTGPDLLHHLPVQPWNPWQHPKTRICRIKNAVRKEVKPRIPILHEGRSKNS